MDDRQPFSRADFQPLTDDEILEVAVDVGLVYNKEGTDQYYGSKREDADLRPLLLEFVAAVFKAERDKNVLSDGSIYSEMSKRAALQPHELQRLLEVEQQASVLVNNERKRLGLD